MRGVGSTKCKPLGLRVGGISEEELEGNGYQADSVAGEHKNDPKTVILTQGH